MILRAYAIYDQKAMVYNTPFYKHTHGEAERDFTTLVNDDKTQINKYPEDFDLYHVGQYDDQTGVFKSEDTPKHIMKAITAKRVVN